METIVAPRTDSSLVFNLASARTVPTEVATRDAAEQSFLRGSVRSDTEATVRRGDVYELAVDRADVHRDETRDLSATATQATSLRGVVVAVEEGSYVCDLQLPSGDTTRVRLAKGLFPPEEMLFGDTMSITIQDVNGIRTPVVRKERPSNTPDRQTRLVRIAEMIQQLSE